MLGNPGVYPRPCHTPRAHILAPRSRLSFSDSRCTESLGQLFPIKYLTLLSENPPKWNRKLRTSMALKM